MDTEFDPSDQFFQAFKAGWLRGRDDRAEPWADEDIWDAYITWLFDEGVTT